jgi:transcriptional regulator with XRE-family HTH domain
MTEAAHVLVAEEVRAQLARKRRSARSVALQLGWQQSYLARKVIGQTPFTIDDLAAIAGVLEVPVTEFFGGLRKPGSLCLPRLAVAA